MSLRHLVPGGSAGIKALAVFAAAALFLAGAQPGFAQSGGDMEALKAEIQALKAGQALMRKDLAVIKQILLRVTNPQRQAQRPAFKPQEMTIAGAATFGAADAPVTLVEFSDYQCPFCRRHHIKTKPQIVKNYVETGKLRYVVREFPLKSIHPKAPKASEAALCAQDQGKYWAMNKAFFANPRALGIDALKTHAKGLGLEMAKFNACLDGSKYAKQVERDLADGMKAGVRGTPTFFFGMTDPADPTRITAIKTLRGALPYGAFKQVIDQLIAQSEKPS